MSLLGRRETKCSFCDKAASEVSKLIEGPGVNICDECVSLCADIVAEDRLRSRIEQAAKQAGEFKPTETSAQRVYARLVIVVDKETEFLEVWRDKLSAELLLAGGESVAYFRGGETENFIHWHILVNCPGLPWGAGEMRMMHDGVVKLIEEMRSVGILRRCSKWYMIDGVIHQQ